jgi:O-acetyl-ADP-ribose deacetylase (regulator of RNase III)
LIYQHRLPSGQILRLNHGDLTEEEVDAIVNAANANLVHGGGVAAAIVARGGSSIQQESDRWVTEHGPITHAQPAITDGGLLPCRYVIHAVGPIWGEGDEDNKLKTAIGSSLQMAESYRLQSIALPAISTGIFSFPKARGARLILDAILEYFQETQPGSLELVSITLIDQLSVDVFRKEFIARWGDQSTDDHS